MFLRALSNDTKCTYYYRYSIRSHSPYCGHFSVKIVNKGCNKETIFNISEAVLICWFIKLPSPRLTMYHSRKGRKILLSTVALVWNTSLLEQIVFASNRFIADSYNYGQWFIHCQNVKLILCLFFFSLLFLQIAQVMRAISKIIPQQRMAGISWYYFFWFNYKNISIRYRGYPFVRVFCQNNHLVSIYFKYFKHFYIKSSWRSRRKTRCYYSWWPLNQCTKCTRTFMIMQFYCAYSQKGSNALCNKSEACKGAYYSRYPP